MKSKLNDLKVDALSKLQAHDVTFNSNLTSSKAGDNMENVFRFNIDDQKTDRIKVYVDNEKKVSKTKMDRSN